VLLSGHLDSWEYGAMDNGSANATMMETMRLLAARRGELRRGVRALFWSGHSHGRYAGSTWYVDHHWQELYEGCVGHVNVDSTGARGATSYARIHAMSDVAALAADVVGGLSGQTPSIGRMGRNSDQSFWGLGIPALFGALSQVPPAQATQDSGSLKALGIGGMPWWWHTVEDTIDKIDPDVLALDTAMVAEATYRLAASTVLPLDYAAMADEMVSILDDLDGKAAGCFDLTPVREELERLREAARALNAVAQAAGEDQAEALNRCLMALGRLLIPLNYTESGPYDQDLAVGIPPWPSLQPVADLAALPAGSDAARYLETKLLRARNRAVHTLRQASAAIDDTLLILGE
jgi:hypothetical protein